MSNHGSGRIWASLAVVFLQGVSGVCPLASSSAHAGPPVCGNDDCDELTTPNLNDPLDPGDCDGGLLNGPCSRPFSTIGCDETIIETTCRLHADDLTPTPGHPFGSDAWFLYTLAPEESGLLTVSICPEDGGDFDGDGMVALYSGLSCPDDISCPALCGDDTCGITNGPASVSVWVCGHAPIYIRVGGKFGSQGEGVLTLTLDFPGQCSDFFTYSALPDRELGLGTEENTINQPCNTAGDCSAFGVGPNVDCIFDSPWYESGWCYASAPRYLSLLPSSENLAPTARRISLDAKSCSGSGTPCRMAALDCPAGESCEGNDTFDPGVDHVLGWVGEPMAVEVVGPEPSLQALSRVVDFPVYRDWYDLSDVHPSFVGPTPIRVGDCEIAPKGPPPETIGNVYFIQSITSDWPICGENFYTSPLRLRTTTRYADVAGAGTGANYPNQGVNLADAFDCVAGFQGTQDIPRWRLDQSGGQVLPTPNAPNFGSVNLHDVFEVVRAFQSGGTYPYHQPCDCPGQDCP